MKYLLTQQTSKKTKRPSRLKYDFPLEKLLQYSHLRQDAAARALGVAHVTLKRICQRRKLRWPYRRLKAIAKRDPFVKPRVHIPLQPYYHIEPEVQSSPRSVEQMERLFTQTTTHHNTQRLPPLSNIFQASIHTTDQIIHELGTSYIHQTRLPSLRNVLHRMQGLGNQY